MQMRQREGRPLPDRQDWCSGERAAADREQSSRRRRSPRACPAAAAAFLHEPAISACVAKRRNRVQHSSSTVRTSGRNLGRKIMLAIRRLLCVSFVLSFLVVPLRAAVTGTVINIDGKAVSGAKVSLFAPELMAVLSSRLQSA